MSKKYFYIFLLHLINYSDAARILGAVFTPSYSHQLAFQPIWKELSLRGHQVTVLTTNPMKDPSLTNLTEIDLSVSYEIMKSHKTDELLSNSQESIAVRFSKYMEALHVTADKQLSHPEVQALIHNKKEQFDLLMVEAIYPTQMSLSWWFQIPFIGLISLDAPSRIHAAVGNPVHPVLYPEYDLPFYRNLTFWERLFSTLFMWFMSWYSEHHLHPREDTTIRKYFGDDVPSVAEIQKNMSMLFINVNPIFHNIRPLVPATVQVGGGIHLQKPKPLPGEIQEYLDSSKNGFVYFSLGTNVKSASISQKLKDTILETFSDLPYNVLWKFENDQISDKPDNVKIVEWAPQTAIMAHKNIKAFITQCGLQSIEEAIYYNVPIVGLPFYGDQGNNAKIMESKRLGVKLKPAELKKDEFLAAILDVSTNSTYKENLKQIAELYNDEAMTGLEKAIWWTEYVIRHKGAKHLRSPAIDLPLYQYYLVDVISFLGGIVIFILFILIITLKIIFKIIFKIKKYLFRSNVKNKKD
ncbi:UDP-glucosyltransferase 2-like isoform X1 [Tenebrio molitor]|uniref:UDP-glucosyltransferase 2-like isoform X1 n=2 Tax=Tenebrio molitor TaxID=7067 RepID=UPI00362492E5